MNSKIFKSSRLLFIFAALLSVTFACKVYDTVVDTHTVTIDANGGTEPSKTTYTVDDGDSFKPDSLPTKTDYDIAYWSTTKDTYSTLFDFDKTPVTSDITLYPHYRYTLAKINNLLTGDWLVSLPGSQTSAKYLFRVNENGKQIYCLSQDSFDYPVNLKAFPAQVEILRAMPVDATSTTFTVGGISYTTTITAGFGTYPFAKVTLADGSQLKCYWQNGNTGIANSLKIQGYSSISSDEIILNNFVNDVLLGTSKDNIITLKTYSDTTITFEAINTADEKGIFTATKM